MLHYAAGEQGVNGEVFANFLDVQVFVLVAEDGVARLHFQVGDVGETGNERFRDSIAKEIGIRIAAGVGERNDGNGVDLQCA